MLLYGFAFLFGLTGTTSLLGIGEVLIPGVFLIWIAIAAAITGLAALALPIGLPLQLLLFAALSLVIAGTLMGLQNDVGKDMRPFLVLVAAIAAIDCSTVASVGEPTFTRNGVWMTVQCDPSRW